MQLTTDPFVMRRRPSIRRFAAAVGVCFVALAATAGPGAAAPPPVGGDQEWPLAEEPGPVELSGTAPRTEIVVDIPPGWAPVGDGELLLDYSTPSLVESAAIGVSLNDVLVDAIALDVGTSTASLALPADRFRSGRNTLGIEASIAVVDDPACPDQRHPARVVTFAETSRVTLRLAPTDTLLDALPAALEPVGLDDRTVTLRLAPSPSDEELTAAAAIVAALRSESSFDIPIEVDSLSSAARANGPDVLIGLADDLEEAGIDVPATPGGYLRMDRTRSSHTRLVVSGAAPDEVLDAVRAIDRAPAARVAAGIEPTPAVEPAATPSRFALAALGYPDRDLVGPGVVSTVYGFDVPLSAAPTSMAVTVDAVRSASGDELSGLSVFVNGTRVRTVHFDVDTGATSGIQLNVSGDVVRPGRNFLRVEAEFQGPSNDCGQRPPDESVEVSATTAIELVSNDSAVSVDLEDLPYLLRSPEDSVDLVVALPVDPTREDLRDAIDIAAVFGDADHPARVVQAGTLDADRLVGLHVIALGEPEVQPLHELLPGSIVATQFDPVDSPLATGDVSTRLNGVIEVLPNPADVTRVIMLATGFDAVGADLAQHVLLDPASRGELYGRATFVGGSPDEPVLAPVLEPVRIERGDVDSALEDDSLDDSTAAVGDDPVSPGPPADEAVVFEVDPVDEGGVLGTIPFGLPGLVLGGIALAAGAAYALTRWRKEQTAGAH